jgi:hypothetical protein
VECDPREESDDACGKDRDDKTEPEAEWKCGCHVVGMRQRYILRATPVPLRLVGETAAPVRPPCGMAHDAGLASIRTATPVAIVRPPRSAV